MGRSMVRELCTRQTELGFPGLCLSLVENRQAESHFCIIKKEKNLNGELRNSHTEL